MQFERRFAEALARADQPQWDFVQAQREVEAVFLQLTGRDERFIRAELSALFSGREPSQREVVDTAILSGTAAGLEAAGTSGVFASIIPTTAPFEADQAMSLESATDRRDASDEDDRN